ncbi:MAG: response regulator [Candidatus Omnitrophica bacterium]|nr:response regulator [Candidatus Omnitrophota bacterium]
MFKSVLLADSDIKFREKFHDTLSLIGHKVDCLTNSEDIFTRLETEKPGLLVLGHDLISLTTYEFLEKLRAIEKQMPVVFLIKESPSTLALSKIKSFAAVDVVKKDFSNHLMFKVILEIIHEPGEKIEEGKHSNLGKILVVDDMAQMRTLVKGLLKFRGFDALEAPGGKEALELTEKEKPRLILLDMRMPQMDGLAVLNKIKEFDNSIKVVMLSGLEDEEAINEALRAGACDFLVKPFDFKKLEVLALAILISISR